MQLLYSDIWNITFIMLYLHSTTKHINCEQLSETCIQLIVVLTIADSLIKVFNDCLLHLTIIFHSHSHK